MMEFSVSFIAVLWGCTVSEAAVRWLPTAVAQIGFQDRSHGICGEQNVHWDKLSPNTSVSPANFGSANCYIFIYHPIIDAVPDVAESCGETLATSSTYKRVHINVVYFGDSLKFHRNIFSPSSVSFGAYLHWFPSWLTFLP
jgi:hypothetical protein